jgi:hypothetical protein
VNHVDIQLVVESANGKQDLPFTVRRLVCAGWVGRDREALRAHMDELADHGVPRPTRTPIYMNFSPYLITTSDQIDVITGESSGEVEFVLLEKEDRVYVGVGSDHTDRELERHSIPGAKQMYAKVMAPTVWPYEEVRNHWDRIIIRSWTTRSGTRKLYQEDSLAAILTVEKLLESLPKDDGLPTDEIILFSGTVATKSGLEFGESFELEMEDPVLTRTIHHRYGVRILPQYL